ncbi:MAG: hypothetical protein ACI35V_00230 [Sphingobacterium composti]|uniref:hypothetical protein n=1 Tax=Sphingobacterium composti TaxID=363260 RepID=UPI00135948E7|nr:hypothetical protein [Sphingobacterium composti Ten et al. 2007 non Yoo et al. 2007]
MDDYSYSLLTNQDMLAYNQNGIMGEKVYAKFGIEVWITRNKNEPMKGWIGIFNRTNSAIRSQLSKFDLVLT